jgi:Immunoglobulin domain
MKVFFFFSYNLFTVPPNIDDSLSSSDVIVREGSNVTLKCRATGSPTPTVKWKRDDNSKIAINKSLNGENHVLGVGVRNLLNFSFDSA